jgi:hypothetical protein
MENKKGEMVKMEVGKGIVFKRGNHVSSYKV